MHSQDSESAIELALETSTSAAGLAIHARGQIFEAHLEPGAAHASDLVQRLADLLALHGLGQENITCVHVGIGPGSFTGLRVAAAVALGLAHAQGTHLVAVPSVAATAYDALQVGEAGTVVLDARGGALYAASYLRTQDGVDETRPPTRFKLHEAPGTPLPHGKLIGDARAAEWFGVQSNPNHQYAGAGLPTAQTILRLGQRQSALSGYSTPEAVRPLYLAAFGA